MTITETCERALEIARTNSRSDHEYEMTKLELAAAAPLLAAEVLRLANLVEIAKVALTELAEGVGGAFSRDQIQHADNCIEAAKARAAEALTQLNQA